MGARIGNTGVSGEDERLVPEGGDGGMRGEAIKFCSENCRALEAAEKKGLKTSD